MPPIRLAVLRQIAFAKSVREIIRSILRRMLDGDWIDRLFSSNENEFNQKLDIAFLGMEETSATQNDYCMAVVNILCDEVSDLCTVLKEVCEGSGYGEVFSSHISHERFVRLVLQIDTVKLCRMQKIVADKSLSPIDILREVGAVVNNESLEERAALGEAQRRQANAELKAIVVDVKNAVQTGFREVMSDISEVKSGVDSVDEKVSRLKVAKKGRGKYDEATARLCVSLVKAACENEAVKQGLNTRVTHKAVFDYNSRLLAEHGITSVAEFTKIIRAQQAREQRQRMKALEAKFADAQ